MLPHKRKTDDLSHQDSKADHKKEMYCRRSRHSNRKRYWEAEIERPIAHRKPIHYHEENHLVKVANEETDCHFNNDIERLIKTEKLTQSEEKLDVEVVDEETDLYFKTSLQTLKFGLPDDQKEIFIVNVLEQTIGKELQLSRRDGPSRCIEMLLANAEDLTVILRFMKAFSDQKEEAFGHHCASHVTENLLYYGIKHMKNWITDVSPPVVTDESTERAKNVIEIIHWIHNLGIFCLENLQTCLNDSYACHVLRTLLQVLGGHYIGEDSNRSKKSKEQKRHFEKEHFDSDLTMKNKEAIILPEVPKFFVKTLKKIAKAFKALQNLKEYALEARTASVIHSLLYVLKQRIPKQCRSLVEAIAPDLFSDTNEQGVPFALLHQSSSFVVQRIFEAALNDQQKNFWNMYFSENLKHLIEDSVGNFVLQRVFDVVSDKVLFEEMHNSLCDHIGDILKSKNYGVLVALASACNKLNCCQAQFLMTIMKSLNCSDPEDRQQYLIRLILGFVKYDEYMERKKSETFQQPIILQGSLVVQAILNFNKPIKVVRSILSMHSEELYNLACHKQGCYILTQFLMSETIGEKNRDKLLENLRPVLVKIALNREGSFTLSRMWVYFSLKQKKCIVEDLFKAQDQYRNNRDAMTMARKFGIFNFKYRPKEWEKFQETLSKKRKKF